MRYECKEIMKEVVSEVISEYEENIKSRIRKRILKLLPLYYIGSPHKLGINSADFLLTILLQEVDWHER